MLEKVEEFEEVEKAEKAEKVEKAEESISGFRGLAAGGKTLRIPFQQPGPGSKSAVPSPAIGCGVWAAGCISEMHSTLRR